MNNWFPFQITSPKQSTEQGLLTRQRGWRRVWAIATGPVNGGLSRLLKRVAAPGVALCLALGGILVGCSESPETSPRQIVINQSWELESGDWVAGHLVTGSLGDVSVQTRGARLRAPYAGRLERAAKGANCVYYSTPEVPAYLFRFCGIRRPHLGSLAAGQVFGHGEQIHFATLRRQPDGGWAIVEPSDHVLEQTLQPAFRPRF